MCAQVAHSAERLTCNQGVVGAKPTLGSSPVIRRSLIATRNTCKIGCAMGLFVFTYGGVNAGLVEEAVRYYHP